jgi:hypothetical protein
MAVNWIALSFPSCSYDHLRIDLMHLTAAIPLFAISIRVIGVGLREVLAGRRLRKSSTCVRIFDDQFF